MKFHITLMWLLSQVTAGNVDHKSIGKIIFGSCNEVQEFGLWSLISSLLFDKLILLGDNMYADTQVSDLHHKPATVNELKDQYEKLFSDPDYKKVITQLGGLEHVFAIYDDHDYGADNADKTYVHKNQSLNLFKEYFRSKNVNSETPSDGVYASFSFNLKNLNIKVVLLDTRFNKSPKSEWATGDFLGENQWVWLEKELNDIVPDVIILGSSIQILPDDKLLEEYWGKFPLARERLFHLVLNSPNNNLFLISGDVHYAEFSQVVCTSVEDEDSNLKEHSPDSKESSKVTVKNLREFTSSGLSHTFSHTLSSSRHPISYGWSMEHMYAAYQSLLPHRYRLHKYKDHYHGPHFGLMNFRHESSTNSYDISIEILNHKGVPVMTSIIPIDVNKPNTKQQHSSGRKEEEEGKKKYVCKPVRGELPYWRNSLYLIILGLILPFFGTFSNYVKQLWVAFGITISITVYFLYCKEKPKSLRKP